VTPSVTETLRHYERPAVKCKKKMKKFKKKQNRREKMTAQGIVRQEKNKVTAAVSADGAAVTIAVSSVVLLWGAARVAFVLLPPWVGLGRR
jgi:hypothetical protein